MKARKLFRRWRRRTAQLLDAANQWLRLARVEGRPEQIHQLRVTLRRLRLVLRLGGACFGRHAIVEFRDWSRQVSDAVGRLRDIDVAVEWLLAQPRGAGLVEALQSRRARRWKSCRSEVVPLPKRVLTRLCGWKAGRKAPARVQKLYLKFFRLHLDETCRVAPRLSGLAMAERHAFRRTLRRLRYLRELGLSRRRHRSDRLLKHLSALQEALGECQNRLVVQAILARRKPSPQLQELRRTLGEEAGHWEKQAQRRLRILARTKGWTANPTSVRARQPPRATSSAA